MTGDTPLSRAERRKIEKAASLRRLGIDPPITRCPVCGVWDGKGSKHADDCLNG